ncbi:MAG: helix-hairpin-helix domain-containing protein [Bacteroidales bacterium]|jgi:competence ComEA-like helix-hairpin-helix protein|nr:helix-hairpin-helix domain-containing protein [Bacteroidales bacterium]MDD2824198.1 helix-hairpin-helix domain-containing protein [Bacteroidales bacterium]MDD3100186.1 helix-hairpin-helix domain-containing protein [Bacteroidales bacterium]MDD3638837.1 helix-hairpin-helix domain-containing protein [Bacteroidales bacterium]MDD3943138.1 helix-hairpin-helix domain-containing protein [Bacteroidales bacterium]
MRWGNRQHYITYAYATGVILFFVSIRILCAQPVFKGPDQERQATEMFRQYCDTSSQVKGRLPARRSGVPKQDTVRVPRSYTPFVPGRVELNTADSAELVKLYGIGPYYAMKIIRYRERLGGFAIPEQLLEVEGIDTDRLEGFYDKVFTDTSFIRKTDLNTATEDQLASHLYIGRYLARCIIRYRQSRETGTCSMEDLVKDKILTDEQALKIRWYLF